MWVQVSCELPVLVFQAVCVVVSSVRTAGGSGWMKRRGAGQQESDGWTFQCFHCLQRVQKSCQQQCLKKFCRDRKRLFKKLHLWLQTPTQLITTGVGVRRAEFVSKHQKTKE